MTTRAKVTVLPLLVVGWGLGCGKPAASTTTPEGGGAASASDPVETNTAGEDDGDDEDAVASDDVDEPSDAGSEDATVGEALLKLELVRGKETLTHPGYMVTAGEEVTIIMEKGGHTHEIDFLFDNAAEGFDVKVEYRDNGKQVLRGDTSTKSGAWFSLSEGKTKLSLQIDADAKRVDEVELSGGDQPLDDM